MVARQAKVRRSRHHHCPRRHLYEIYVRYLLRLSYSALGIVERGQLWAVWGFQTRLWSQIDSSLREPVSKANDGPGSALAALSGSERPVSPKECESKKRSGQIRMTNSFFDTCRQQQKPRLVNQSWNNPRGSAWPWFTFFMPSKTLGTGHLASERRDWLGGQTDQALQPPPRQRRTPATVTPGTVLSFGTLLLAQRGNGD